MPVKRHVRRKAGKEKKMDVNATNIEEIVRQVLNSMEGHTGAGKSVSGNVAGEIPKTARVAMLTSLEHYDIKEFPIPEVGDDDILVKVEGCGICGTDAHEFKKDPFGLIPVALGHEGTGEIVKMGKNVKKDSAGNDLSLAGTAGAAAAGARQQKTGFVTGFKNGFSGFGLELIRRAGEFDRKRHNSFLLT